MRRTATLALGLALLGAGAADARAQDTGGATPPSDNVVAASDDVVAVALAAGDALQGKPYRWGGGHRRWADTGYDCSGAVSYVLHAAGLLEDPLDSSGLARWGVPGRGRLLTVYANRSHAFVVIAGRRLDTAGGRGPRWHSRLRSTRGFTARHPPGL
jgi:hypothetical protein